MKRRKFIQTTGAAGLSGFFSSVGFSDFFYKDLASLDEKNFRNPAAASYPHVFWHWMNGHVSKDGITKDLEAMRKIGIAGVFNFDVGTGIPKGPVEYLSNEWLLLKEHAIREADRLGLAFTMHNCPGWSSSGGPWITPELAMQQVTWSEEYVAGGKNITVSLRKPIHKFDHYHDISVIAFPSLQGEDLMQTMRVRSAAGDLELNLLSGEQSTGATVYPVGDQPAWIGFEFERPFEARQLTFFISAIETASNPETPVDFGERTSVNIESSTDGKVFRNVTSINTGLETELRLGDKYIVFDIPVTTAKYFRITSNRPRRYRQVQFSSIHRLENWMEKTNTRARHFTNVTNRSTLEQINSQSVSPRSVIDPKTIVDLTPKMDAGGTLRWNAPAGNWTILRIGFTPIGTRNRAAPNTGIGLECDKYNPEAISFHFKKMMERLLPASKALASKKRMALEIDSYEVGCQNWTPGFENTFRERWKYGIVQYLPVLAGGRIVDSVLTTERFLWDFRRLQADLIAENYYRRFTELCHEHGLKSYIQPYESGPMEEMQIGSRADMNLGEFLNGISTSFPAKTPVRRTPKLASSIAHTNGQHIVAAEAFTSEPDSGRWQEYPFALKAIGDKNFTRGINQLVIHRFTHQPHPTAIPGMTMGPWGMHFDRTNTWWTQARAWLDYLARCQATLQKGSFVADLVYFTGEDANMYTRASDEELIPHPPQGYHYDMVNAETILKAKVDNGHIVIGEIPYRFLILQDFKVITLPIIRKIRDFVQEGLTIVGAKPQHLSGLHDAQLGNTEFTTITNELWNDEASQVDNRFGKGRVIWGKDLAQILEEVKIEPDFQYSSRSGDAPILYTHRKTDDTDIYFISNQRRKQEELTCTFRVNSKQPEFWNPVTGEIIPAKIFDIDGERMRLPVSLPPYGSTFVVFRTAIAKDFVNAIEKDGTTLINCKNIEQAPGLSRMGFENNFTVSFWAKPEMNVLLDPVFHAGSIAQPWTEFFAIYPSDGGKLFGNGHAACGIAVGRNGIAVWENADGTPILVLPAPAAIEGWSSIVLQYNNGIPWVYINGRLVKKGTKNKYQVHPPGDKVLLSEGASYYNGDITAPTWVNRILSEIEIRELAKLRLYPGSDTPDCYTHRAGLLFNSNGRYSLRTKSGKTLTFSVSTIHPELAINGPWKIRLRHDGSEIEAEITQLHSLHHHEDPRIKYFSGTLIYFKEFAYQREASTNKRFFLDLGGVEVIAEVILNGKNLGLLWTRPYETDITSALVSGMNRLEVRVTSLLPNRLIGDEQFPDPDSFEGGGGSGRAGLIEGYIKALPNWYVNGESMPRDKRTTFATWKHYLKTSPLLESGLIGPVSIRERYFKSL